jgi:hypothetical protein
MTVDEGSKTALTEDDFTLVNACVFPDVFIHMGFSPENKKHYIEVVSRLQRRHFTPTA